MLRSLLPWTKTDISPTLLSHSTGLLISATSVLSVMTEFQRNTPPPSSGSEKFSLRGSQWLTASQSVLFYSLGIRAVNTLTLKKEAVCLSEKFVHTQQTTQCHTPCVVAHTKHMTSAAQLFPTTPVLGLPKILQCAPQFASCCDRQVV